MPETTPFTIKANKFGKMLESLPEDEYITVVISGETLQLELGSSLPFDGMVDEIRIMLSPIHVAMLYPYFK